MADRSSLARLTSLPPREVWPHEAADFTPWLLDNADVLSEALGMDLELEAAEHPVGSFSLDLIGVDRRTGERVIVENQLEGSDHIHLGQILTYAGGTDARNVVWVAPSFRSEHRAALEWLNERTDERTRFFAVQVEVVRIGDSPAAPLLTLTVRPNDWGKQVRATAGAQGRRWAETDLMEALAAGSTPQVHRAAVQLLEHHRSHGPAASFYWGEGRVPSVTGVLQGTRARIQPWTLVAASPTTKAVWALNLDWIHKSGEALPAEAVTALVEALSDLPSVHELCRGAAEVGWRRRPSIPADALFGDPRSVPTITQALDEVYRRIQLDA